MIIVTQSGRLCKIEGNISDKLNNYIYKTLSYTKPGARFMANPFWAIVRLYNKEKHIFPIGLLWKVMDILREWNKQYGDSYLVQVNEPLKQYPVQLSNLRDYQVDAFNAVWKNNGGLLVAPTGSGKTVIAERILVATGDAKKLVLVPSKDLKYQWEKELENMLTTFPDLIRVTTYQKLIREIQTKEGKAELNKYDVIVADETHMVAAKTFYKVLMNCGNAKMVIGMTATAEGRSDGEDLKIKAAVGNIIYSIPIQKLTEQGYLVPARVFIEDIERYQNDYMEEYRDIYKNGIVLNRERNSRAVDIAIRESKKGVVLIYIDIIEHGDIIVKMLEEQKQKDFVFVHGNVKERKQILQDVVDGKYKIVIGSKIYGTGINVPKFTTLVLVGGGKGTIKTIQLVGRMLRTNEGKDIVNIYDFKDGCKNLRTHYQKRIKIYKNLGFEVNENGEESN